MSSLEGDTTLSICAMQLVEKKGKEEKEEEGPLDGGEEVDIL
jgi:hypothetical protein